MRLATRQPGPRRPAASIVEFTLVALVFFMVLLAVLEYARLLFTIEMLNNAAREGARYAAVNTTTETTAGVQNYVDNYLAGQGAAQLTGYSPSTSITVYRADPATGQNLGTTWQNSSWGDGVGVSITGTYKPVVPGLLKLTGSLTLTGTCVISAEAN